MCISPKGMWCPLKANLNCSHVTCALAGREDRKWVHQIPAGPCSWWDAYSSFWCSVTLSRRNFCLIVLSHSSAWSGSSATLKIGGLVSRNSLKVLYWFVSGPCCCGWARAVFYAMRHRASSIVLWLSKNWANNSFADGGGGGGKSPSLTSWLLLTPARVRVICKLATISDYWMMLRDCRWII